VPGFLIIFLPLSCGILTSFAILYLGSLVSDHVIFKLNYINIVAFPVLLGVGIDNGLHLYRRLKEHPVQDIKFVMSETGNAVFLSNFTTFIGFLSLVFASHRGLSSLGFLAAIGIANIFISYSVIFPFLTKLFHKIGWKIN